MTTFYYWQEDIGAHRMSTNSHTAAKHSDVHEIVAENIDRAWDIAFDRYVNRAQARA